MLRRTGIRLHLACTALLLAGMPGGWGVAAEDGTGKPESAQSPLAPPEAAPLPGASGTLDVKLFPEVGNRAERGWLRIRAKKLEKKATYDVFIDDPAEPGGELEEAGELTTSGNGNLNFRWDSKNEGKEDKGNGRGKPKKGLPFGATLEELAGAPFELRDQEGAVVLAGVVPGLDGGGPPACLFLADFDEDAPGAPPSGWDILYPLSGGSEIVVDSSIRDGSTGNSVRMHDVSGNVFIAKAIPEQAGTFSVTFVMFSSASQGEIFLRLGKQGAANNGEVSGLGNGFGFYGDGTIGFNMGDSVQSYALSTRYEFRLDVDVPSGVFDVYVDGNKLVDQRALGATTSSLDYLIFGSSASLNGTANIDTICVSIPTE